MQQQHTRFFKGSLWPASGISLRQPEVSPHKFAEISSYRREIIYEASKMQYSQIQQEIYLQILNVKSHAYL